jgi:hypothetical protein
MTPTIRIDDDLYSFLKDQAEPFVDTPNSVLRRLLELPSRNGDMADVGFEEPVAPEKAASPSKRSGAASPGRAEARSTKSRKKRGRQRATRGSLVPQAEYELPILKVLDEKGGRAPSREVIDAIEPMLADQLKDVDRSKTSSGEIRWRNRAQFVRLSLIDKGELVKDSPRGVWEITDAGRNRVKGA